jgi:hypothetical protein
MKTLLLDPEMLNMLKSLLPAFVGILGVIVGFALNRVYEWRKEHRRLNKLITALYIELGDVSRWLVRAKLSQEKALKLLVHRSPPDSLPIQIPTHVYDHYFDELSIHLSDSERLSFNNIYFLVEQINSQHQRLNSLLIECIKDKERLQEVSYILEGAHVNLLTALAQANFHITNQKRFNMKKLWRKQSTTKYLNITGITDEDAALLDKQIRNSLLNLRSQAQSSTVEKIRQEIG